MQWVIWQSVDTVILITVVFVHRMVTSYLSISTLEQFTELMEVLGDMLNQIDRQRRSKMIDEAVDMATGDHHEPVRYSKLLKAIQALWLDKVQSHVTPVWCEQIITRFVVDFQKDVRCDIYLKW